MRITWACALFFAVVIGTVVSQQDDDYWYSDLQFEPDYEWYPDLALGTLSNGDKEPSNESSSSEEKSKEETKNDDNEEKQVKEDITNFMNKLDGIADYQFEDNRSEAKEQQAIENEKKAEETTDNKSSSENENQEVEIKAGNLKDTIVDGLPSVEENKQQDIIDETKTLLDKADEDSDETKFAAQIASIQKDNTWRSMLAESNSDQEPDKDEISKELLDELNDLFKTAENDNKDNEDIFNETKSILDHDKEDKIESLKSEEKLEDVAREDNNNKDIFDETKAILSEPDNDNDSKFEETENNSEVKSIWRNVEILNEAQKLLESEESTEEIKNDNVKLQDLLEETKNILNDSDNDDDISKFLDEQIKTEVNPIEPNAAILEETQQLLNEKVESTENINTKKATSDSSSDESVDNALNIESNESDVNDQADEDTVDNAYADLNDDLKQLFETWDKLTNDESKEDEDVLGYEEKYGKPYKEDVVLSQREDYDNTADKSEADTNKEELEDSSIIEDDTAAQENQDKEINDENKNESFSDDDSSEENTNIEIPEEIDDTKVQDTNIESIKDDIALQSSKLKTLSVDELNPAQYDDLMRQFKDSHMEAFNIDSNGIGSHVAPIHVAINVDEAVEVTSPDYPRPYPTNNIIDWIFDGEGTGIELNITDFAINGLFEDYLLVIPGGADNSRTDGLLFSHQLNEERFFRFLDVDRLFVRFVSNPGMPFFRGFKFSVRMIAPVPEEEEELEPEVQLPAVPANLTLNLGGITPRAFRDIREDFQQLVADMALMYINRNSIEPGLNTTSEVAQITSVTLCNVDWPNFENCTQVKFGVPIVEVAGEPATRLTEEELKTMWNTYIERDPFTLRLRRMGVTEFDIPNDGQMLLVWLVIAIGVLISVAMLAFALWKFSCFEDYTRMAAYSDTDSVNEKRGLDLYPTPHQTLPPLFAENEYKWDDGTFDDSTRVDIGGYANRSYVRDDLFDIDSDEDVVVAPRDRSAAVSSRDIYQV